MVSKTKALKERIDTLTHITDKLLPIVVTSGQLGVRLAPTEHLQHGKLTGIVDNVGCLSGQCLVEIANGNRGKRFVCDICRLRVNAHNHWRCVPLFEGILHEEGGKAEHSQQCEAKEDSAMDFGFVYSLLLLLHLLSLLHFNCFAHPPVRRMQASTVDVLQAVYASVAAKLIRVQCQYATPADRIGGCGLHHRVRIRVRLSPRPLPAK